MQSTIPQTSGIYKWVCIPTGKLYVGSAVNLRNRWRHHRKALRGNCHTNPYLQRAWNKYGEDAFKFTVIELVLAPFLLEREQYWMDKLHACDRDKGFNSYPTAGSPMGRVVSEESRRKMSESHKGRIYKPAKSYIVISPEGIESRIDNLASFCREHDLKCPSMHRLNKNLRLTHKGWRCRHAED